MNNPDELRAKIEGWIAEETGVTGGTVYAWIRAIEESAVREKGGGAAESERDIIYSAAKSCRARAFDMPIDNSYAQKLWQQHADGLLAIVDRIDAGAASPSVAGMPTPSTALRDAMAVGVSLGHITVEGKWLIEAALSLNPAASSPAPSGSEKPSEGA
jgi:hypothetical protein